MRILLAAHGFPPTHSAGAERQTDRMARWLVAHNHHVEVFAVEKINEPGFRVETGVQDGFTVHRLFYDIKAGNDPFRNEYDYPPIGDALRELLQQRTFDLIHLISGYLLAGQVIHTAHEMNMPVIVSLMEFWFMCARLNLIQATGKLCNGPESYQKCARCLMEEKRRYRLPARVAPALMDMFWLVAQHLPSAKAMTETIIRRDWTLRRALDAADLVICISQHQLNLFSEFDFNKKGHFVCIPFGLDMPVGGKPNHARQQNGLRLGYIGQIKEHKGVDLAVDAVVELLDAGEKVSLDLWGPEAEAPHYVAELKRRSANYPNIRWNGHYTGSKVWEVLAELDVLVVPSRWYETGPAVIREAFVMGLPVVATNLGNMAILVEHEKSGLLFELNNTLDLRRQLERLLHEPGLLDRLRAGIPPVKTIDEEMQEIVAHYTRLLARSQ